MTVISQISFRCHVARLNFEFCIEINTFACFCNVCSLVIKKIFLNWKHNLIFPIKIRIINWTTFSYRIKTMTNFMINQQDNVYGLNSSKYISSLCTLNNNLETLCQILHSTQLQIYINEYESSKWMYAHKF